MRQSREVVHSRRHWFWPPRCVLLCFISCLAVFCATSLTAQTLDWQYAHTAWTWENGFKLFPIQAIAQTSDGYLWLGTPSGLWKFDGDRFTEWQPAPAEVHLPSPDIRALYAANNGPLWIGTAAGISRLHNGVLTNYQTVTGVRALLDDPSRGLWALTNANPKGGLILFGHPEPSVFGPNQGLPGKEVNTIFRDREGALWVGTQSGIWRWQGTRQDTFLADPPTQVYSICEDAHKHVVIACNARSRLMHFVNGEFQPLELTPGQAAPPVRAVLSQRDGGMWAATFSDGVVHLQGGRIQPFTRHNGLSGAAVLALFQDRDENIWVGTRTGLDRFRFSGVSRVSQDTGLSEDLVTAVQASRDGGVWVGTASAGLNYVRERKTLVKRTADGLPSNSILSLYEEPDGRLWIGTTRGLVVQHSDRLTPIHGPDGLPFNRVTAIAGDAKGRIWIADADRGVYTVGRAAVGPRKASELPLARDIYSMMAGSDGKLWIGYYHGEAAAIGEDRVSTYQANRDLAPGPVIAFEQSADSIWVASKGGLSRFRHGRWTTWRAGDVMLPGDVLAMHGDGVGGLWLGTSKAVLRLALTELDAQADGNPRPPGYLSYDKPQGVPPHVSIVRAQPRVSKAGDGRLWFAGEAGVAIIDPAKLRPAMAPPHIVIEQIKADGRDIWLRGPEHAPVEFRGRELQLDFTAASPGGFDGVQFDYQLQGFDREPIRAGTIRHARYTNLPPGRYPFVVSASNPQDRWAATSVPLTFVALPVFYQTLAFRLVCFPAIFVLLYAIHKWRLKQLSRRTELLAQERLAERTRIAGDLHDTLLQSVVGATLQLEAMSNRMTSPEPPVDDLRRVRLQLSDALFEARHAVWALRAPILRQADLPDAVRHRGGTLIGSRGIRLEVQVEGDPFRLPLETEDQILLVAQEAIANAAYHSGGREIRVEFQYSPAGLEIRVSDNGHGFDPKIVESGRPGHFGLSGMRERARMLGAQLAVSTSPAGTQVTMTWRKSRRPLRWVAGLWSRIVRRSMWPVPADR